VKADTAQIPSIKQDTAQIEGLVQQIGLLRLQLDSGPMNDAKARHLQMFLDQSTSYAETVIDAIDDEEYQMQPSEGIVSELSHNNRHFATTNVNATSSNHDIPVQAGGRLYIARSTSDQSGTLKNTIEDEESCAQSSRNSLSRRSSENWDIPIADAGAAGAYHDSATRASSQLPATGDIMGLDTATTATTGASSLSETPEADNKLRQRALAKPRMTLPDGPRKMLLLPTRDQNKIQQASTLRKEMAFKEQETLNEALEIAIRGKKSPIDRLRPKSAWFSKRTGSYDEIKDLLDRGADPDYRSHGADFCRLEMWNAKRLEVLQLLLQRGASFWLSSSDEWLVVAARSSWPTLVENFLDSGSSLSARDKALCEAASAGHNGIVRILLMHGTSSVSQSGKDAATREASRCRRFETLKLLLEHGASADNDIFFTAVKAGREDILRMLLDRGFSANTGDSVQTALGEAVRFGHLKSVNLLLERGAGVSSALLYRAPHPESSRSLAERNEMTALLKRYYEQQNRLRPTKSP
jgi:ankyrin repeat protein